MDFRLGDEQRALRDLAREIFAGHCTPERLRIADGFDRVLWAELARANLLGATLPAEHGGGDLGPIEACLLLEEQGRAVAPVPLWSTLVGGMAIARYGTPAQRARWLPPVVAGEALIALALEGEVVHENGRLRGSAGAVPFAPQANALLVAAGGDVFLAEHGATVEPQATTSEEPWGRIVLDDVEAEPLGDRDGWTRAMATVGLCATQVGLAEEALRITASYTTGREQFGKPLGSFQAVQQRAADAYIDTEAMRLCTLQAAWLLAEGAGAEVEVAVAKWWAADGGQRVVEAAQHLHGGIGVDVDYPLWRYTVRSKQCELLLGGASAQLAELGELIAR